MRISAYRVGGMAAPVAAGAAGPEPGGTTWNQMERAQYQVEPGQNEVEPGSEPGRVRTRSPPLGDGLRPAARRTPGFRVTVRGGFNCPCLSSITYPARSE